MTDRLSHDEFYAPRATTAEQMDALTPDERGVLWTLYDIRYGVSPSELVRRVRATKILDKRVHARTITAVEGLVKAMLARDGGRANKVRYSYMTVGHYADALVAEQERAVREKQKLELAALTGIDAEEISVSAHYGNQVSFYLEADVVIATMKAAIEKRAQMVAKIAVQSALDALTTNHDDDDDEEDD